MTISKDHLELEVQTNHSLQANIWEALKQEAALNSLDLGSLSIKAQNGEVTLNGYLKEENQPLVESTIHSVVGVVEVHNHLRTNAGILADIWDALWKEDTTRSLDLGSLSIEVKDGEVTLIGHLARENNLLLIERIARSVAGVVAVHNRLVTDRDLIIRVAYALARDKRTRHYLLPVNVIHGWIHLGGVVPNHEIQSVVEIVAGGVSGVRGVVSLPRIAGESPNRPRSTVQPRIGAVVYGENGEAGVVAQVVIQPKNQLVTHFVVRSKELKEGNLVAHETVVPLGAIDLVKDESIFFQRNGPFLNAFPALDPDDYPLAPFTWQAPYPYTAGEVLWSLQEILDAEDRPEYQPEGKPGSSIQRALEQVMAQAA